MQYRWKRVGRGISIGVGFRIVFGAVIVVALATNLFDPWVVPFAERTYGVYRADFINDIDRATDIDRLGGSLGLGNSSLELHTWVGRNR